jgi:putative tryptophan/tyrosine transport system substrate-binding protein
MRRRDVITGIGGIALAWPRAARAQQAMPVIGFLDSRSPDGMTSRLNGFRRGLKETGLIEGENVAIEYRWAENRMDRLPDLAADLVRRRVAIIVSSGGLPSALAAKAATKTIPVIFLVGADPAKLGLVASLARPTGNLTGINLFNSELEAKRLELLRELVPRAARIAVLANQSEPVNAETVLHDVRAVAPAMGLEVQFFYASTPSEIDVTFANIAREKPDAMFFGSSAFMNARRVQLVQLAAFHRIPAAYPGREAVDIGGLMSYGSDIVDAHRLLGVHAGRVFKGAKPADLPVIQTSKFELVINLRTARMLGLTVPQTLLTAADEVIE